MGVGEIGDLWFMNESREERGLARQRNVSQGRKEEERWSEAASIGCNDLNALKTQKKILFSKKKIGNANFDIRFLKK